MRTTLDIDEDVLLAAKHTAQREKKSIGLVISDLARKGLQPTRQQSKRKADDVLAALGIKPLPKTGAIVTDELINRIRDEQGI